jgi:hypothetical protein
VRGVGGPKAKGPRFAGRENPYVCL